MDPTDIEKYGFKLVKKFNLSEHPEMENLAEAIWPLLQDLEEPTCLVSMGVPNELHMGDADEHLVLVSLSTVVNREDVADYIDAITKAHEAMRMPLPVAAYD